MQSRTLGRLRCCRHRRCHCRHCRCRKKGGGGLCLVWEGGAIPTAEREEVSCALSGRGGTFSPVGVTATAARAAHLDLRMDHHHEVLEDGEEDGEVGVGSDVSVQQPVETRLAHAQSHSNHIAIT